MAALPSDITLDTSNHSGNDNKSCEDEQTRRPKIKESEERGLRLAMVPYAETLSYLIGALFRCVHQKATIAECRVYFFNLDPLVDPYSHLQLHRDKELLGPRRKVTSTPVDLAYAPLNLAKHDNYWQQPPPLGMLGVATEDTIDTDEAGLSWSTRIEVTGRPFPR